MAFLSVDRSNRSFREYETCSSRPVKTGFGTGRLFPRKIRVQSYTRDRGVDFDRTKETIISTVPLLRLLREGEIEEEKERREGGREGEGRL